MPSVQREPSRFKCNGCLAVSDCLPAWLTDWLFFQSAAWSVYKEVAEGRGCRGMGWNSFSLPVPSLYPFHHGRWRCAPRAGNQTKWVEGHCRLQESPCAVRNPPPPTDFFLFLKNKIQTLFFLYLSPLFFKGWKVVPFEERVKVEGAIECKETSAWGLEPEGSS